MRAMRPQRHAWYEVWASSSLLALLTCTTNVTHGNERPQCELAVLTMAEAAELLRVDVDEIRRLAEQDEVPGRRVGSAWRFNCGSLLAWLNGDWERKSATDWLPTGGPSSFAAADARAPLTPSDLARVTAAGTAGEQSGSPPAPNEPPPGVDEDTPIGEAPEEPTAEDMFLRSQRVLLGPGEAVLDFGQFYAESDRQELTPLDGGTVLATVEQGTLLTSLQGRIGFRNETEMFVGTTYFDQDSDVFFGGRKTASSGTSEFGSVSLGVRRTFMREGPGRPDIIGTLSTSVPTGDTSYALGGGLAFVKSVDPVVLFATIGYTHTFSENFADLMRLEPKDRIDLAFGYAVALNDTLALSMSVSGAVAAATRFNDTELRQRESYALRFGLTSWLARRVYIEPSVSFNLGDPDDGFVFGITVPYTLGRLARARP